MLSSGLYDAVTHNGWRVSHTEVDPATLSGLALGGSAGGHGFEAAFESFDRMRRPEPIGGSERMLSCLEAR